VPRVSREHVDARRREILGAAFRCFARTGVHGTTMQEIASEAGLSAGALYRYFEGKEALFEALAAYAADRRVENLSSLESGRGAEGLAEVVAGMMAELGTGDADASVRLDVRLWAEALDHPSVLEIARRALASVREPVAGYVRAGQGAGTIRSVVDPEAVGRAVVSLLVGLELQRALGEDVDLENYRGAVRDLLSGLGSRSG